MTKLKQEDRRTLAAECIHAVIMTLADSKDRDDDYFAECLAWIVDSWLKGELRRTLSAHGARLKRKSMLEREQAGPSRN
jgi:hypothetical protein